MSAVPALKPASVAPLRQQIEATLGERMPGAFRVYDRTALEMAASGVAAFDALTGGLPRGGLTEIFGAASSGRSTLLVAALAAATARDETCCLIDAGDSFDPESAAAAGVRLEKVLWVRCGRVASDELRVMSKSRTVFTRDSRLATRHYTRIEQALKAADLVLQAGGFGLVVVDLAAVAVEAARRVPLASWFRFRRAVENTRSVFLVVSAAPLTHSCATLAVKLEQAAVSSEVSASSTAYVVGNGKLVLGPPHAQLLDNVQWGIEVVRAQAARRKAAQGADFVAHF